MFLQLQFAAEEIAGEKWKSAFDRLWVHYKKWFLSEGFLARTGYLSSSNTFRLYMPELFPVYEHLTAIAGGGDLEARFLSLYNPPPFMSACSQLVWHNPEPVLLRNYDYSPFLFEGMVWKTHWLKPVIAVSDCIWGVLDGINGDGLCASLTFGGRKVVGNGFGIPIILRYILETCETVEQAKRVLDKIPSHMAYNVTLLDAKGDFETVFVAPEEPPIFTNAAFCTNHQAQIEWEAYANMSGTLQREQFLEKLYRQKNKSIDEIAFAFLRPPLHHVQYQKGFGTLYTALYFPVHRSLQLLWRGQSVLVSFRRFEENKMTIPLLTSNIGKGNMIG
jgi:predicted choloylglycine hydrolase